MDTQKKGIGKGELIALIVSSCIGTGIFGITSDVAAAAAPGPVSFSLAVRCLWFPDAGAFFKQPVQQAA